jgi:hypothetical protein
MKIRPVGAELFHANRITEGRKDRRTNGRINMTKLIVAFHNLRRGLKRNMHKEGSIVYTDLRITLVD